MSAALPARKIFPPTTPHQGVFYNHLPLNIPSRTEAPPYHQQLLTRTGAKREGSAPLLQGKRDRLR
jgi:hypothetical protein